MKTKPPLPSIRLYYEDGVEKDCAAISAGDAVKFLASLPEDTPLVGAWEGIHVLAHEIKLVPAESSYLFNKEGEKQAYCEIDVDNIY